MTQHEHESDSDSMLGRVANAIAAELFNSYKNVACHISPAVIGPLSNALARAALQAMREPTDSMIYAGTLTLGACDIEKDVADEIFRVMIDAALNGAEQQK